MTPSGMIKNSVIQSKFPVFTPRDLERKVVA